MLNNKVLIIVINYKTSHLIQALINSITEDKVEISILVVDNESTEETFNELTSITDPRLHIVRSGENLGFTGGINFGLTYATDHLEKFTYFFLLNPDAFSCHNLISDLTGILEANKEAACISPKIVNLNGEPWYSGARINYSKGKVSTSIPVENENAGKYYEVDAFCGCAVLFDLEKVRRAGMFNESLFMYYDEADLSIRLKNLGYKILYTPYYKIFHDVSYTTRHISFLKTYYLTRNKFIVFGKLMTFYNKFYFLAHELLFHLKNSRFKNALYHIKGYFHYKKGKSGQYINIL